MTASRSQQVTTTIAKGVSNLAPRALWSCFADVCRFPHPSNGEKPLVQFIKSFAEERGLQASIDKTGNLLIRKSGHRASDRRCQTVVLQAHLDMVAQKENGSTHDFQTDSIIPIVDDGWVRANGTTLGADNGIGVAAIMAVLASEDISHGPLEALLTVNEEAGMTGAAGLAKGLLKGRWMLNLDAHNDDEICVGCAGTIETTGTARLPCTLPQGPIVYAEIGVKGLRGGHSALDINLGRGNANVLLARAILSLSSAFDCHLCSFKGGTAVNAIPREASAIVMLSNDQRGRLTKVVKKVEAILRAEFADVEPDLSVTCAFHARAAVQSLAPKAQSAFLRALVCCPNGAIRMSPTIPDMIELSNNVGIVELADGTACVQTLQRSPMQSLNIFGADMVRGVFELAGMSANSPYASPPWIPNFSSALLTRAVKSYKNIHGTEPRITVTHGGLECKLFAATYPDMDIISIGPTIVDLHSPSERVEIASVERFWRYLVDILQSTPKAA